MRINSVSAIVLLSFSIFVKSADAQKPENPKSSAEKKANASALEKEAVKLKPQAGTVKANGITIAYESFGSEKSETVLLIMGTGAQLTVWNAELCEELVRRGYRVIRFDNRDVGLSTKFETAGKPDYAAIGEALKTGRPAPLAYTLADMAKDAVGLLDALKIRKAHIVGFSMGGAIAQLVAADYPERTLSLTSIGASSGNPALPKPKPEVFAALLTTPPAAGNDEAIVAYRLKIERAIGSPVYPTDEKTIRERTLRDAGRSWYPAGAERQAAAAFVADSGGMDRRAKLRTIKAPTVVLHGADDPLVPLTDGKDVAANIKGSELRVISGLGHDLPLALVKDFADAITAAAAKAKPSFDEKKRK